MHIQLSARVHSAPAICCVVTAPRRASACNAAAARTMSLPTGITSAKCACYAAPHLPRVPPLQQQLPTAPATAAATPRGVDSGNVPEFSLEECAEEIQRWSPGTSLTDVLEALQLCIYELPQVPQTADPYWMLVQCGEWELSAKWAGATPGAPARAVLCFTPPFGKNGGRDYNVYAFALNHDGIPNSEMFNSPTEFEGMTNKVQGKKFRQTCRILYNGRDFCAVEKFITNYFGEQAIHIPKLARANRSPAANAEPSVQLRQSSTGSSSSSSAVDLRIPPAPPSVQLRNGAAGSRSGATSTGLGNITGSPSHNNISNTGSSKGSRRSNSPQVAPSVQLRSNARRAGSTSDATSTGLGNITGSASNNNTNSRSRRKPRRRKATDPEA